MKDKYDHRLLLKHLPSEFKCFLDHISQLEYADKPNYHMLFVLFEQCLRRKGIKGGGKKEVKVVGVVG